MKAAVRLVSMAGLALGCQAQQASRAAEVLPLRSVKLYEVGVAYFERAGVISGEQSVLPVPASHVDDALKTLVVLGDGGRTNVAAVEFDSLVSRGLARSLAALPLDPDKPVTYRDVLESLRGVEVELATADGTAIGTLVEVAAEERAGASEQLTLTLLERDGSVRTTDVRSLRSMRPSDPILAARLRSAVAALAGRAAQMPRALSVAAASRSAVRLGYIAETPVWRSTYRVLFGSGDSATLEGWALIHNDTDEAWSNVRIELVNGRPDSFLFPLSAPRYARRPLAEPLDRWSTVPQLADKTADQLWGDNLDDGETGLSLSGQGYGGGGSGYGSGAGRLHVQQQSALGPSGAISIGNLAEIAQATGVETGALFNYRLGNTLTLRAHGSALVPFTQRTVQARRISWFEPGSRQGQSGARFVNATNQTLPAGPAALYEPSGFAGETGLPRLKPGERAFLRFGVDLDLELKTQSDAIEEQVQRLELDGGHVVEHFLAGQSSRYALESRAQDPRLVYVVLNIVSNARVTGADELDFDAEQGKPLAVFRVPPRGRVERRLATVQALARRHAIASLDAERVARWAAAPALAPEQPVLAAVSRLLEVVGKHDRARSASEAELRQIEQDLGRMREHLQAAGDKQGAAPGNNPLVLRLLELENRLSATRRRTSELADSKERDLAKVAEELRKLHAPAKL